MLSLLLGAPARAGMAVTNFSIGPSIPFAVGFDAGPQSFVVQDMNRDGLADVVAIDQINGGVAVLLNQGGGSFGDPQSVQLDVFPTALAVAELNGDGSPDVAVTDDDGGLAILFGSPNGTIQVNSQPDPGIELAGVTAADFDEDGHIDLAVLEVCDEVVLQRNVGNGTFDCFDEELLETTSTDPIALASADVNGDHHVDLIVLNRLAENVTLFRGMGDGTFQPAELFPVGSSPRGLAVGRVDGDTRDDVVVVEAGFFDHNITVLLGDALLGLRAIEKSAAGVNATSIALADFNGDHCLDFISPSLEETVPALGLGDCTGHFASPIASAMVGFARAVGAGRLNKDGRPDFIVLDEDGEALHTGINETPALCAGDCDGGGAVTVSELVTAVNIALDRAAVSACSAVDGDGNGRVTIDELVRSVGNLLAGCQ